MEKWEEVGSGESIISALIPGPDYVVVRNTDTGETGTVYVGGNQTVGEAIAEGQWHERPSK